MNKGSLKLLCASLVLVAPAAVIAQGPRQDGNGTVWQTSINRSGAVLRSRGHTIYLGRNCDAQSSRYGRGRWEWANGGFVAVFRNVRVGFPRQEIEADPTGRCRS